MEDRFKYLEYTSDDSDYYQKSKSNSSLEFNVDCLDDNWVVNKEDPFWTMYFIPEIRMIEQGFKIHVSTTYENATTTLNIVSKLLVELKIAFKHVKDKGALYNMYSKHGSRTSSGKFITIYPNEEEFVPLLKKLEEVLIDQPKGPYILTDRRWKNSNIYYRYGAFKSLKDEKGRYCIVDPKGELIVDKREPKFYLPDFVELPNEIKKQDELMKAAAPKVDNPLNLYNIESVLRFSNAGGIYKATRKSDGKKCVIKEARYEIGLDGQSRNAMNRLQAEYDALSKLQGVAGVMQLLDYFEVWENKFLVVEFVEGVSLYSWASANYPFSHKEDVKEYFAKVIKIVERLKTIVEQMHQRNVAMCDLQHQNIIIDENLEINIIDFEIAEDKNNDSLPALATRGFSNMHNTIAKDRDWYSLNRIIQFLLLPIGPVYDMDMSVNLKHCLWIYNNFGSEIYEYFYNFQMETRDNITNFDKIFSNTFDVAKSQIDMGRTRESLNAKDTLDKLKNALIENCNSKSKGFINGDIRQYEMDCGLLNLQNGGFGAILALLRLDNLTDDSRQWIEDQIPDLLNSNYNNGFLTGRSGIACVLYECGYKKEAVQLMDLIIDSYDKTSEDMSLRSGLSGIGIALACIGKEENKQTYLSLAKEIAQILIDKVDNNEEPIGTDWQSYSVGILDGYAGISLFLTLLYEVTQNEKYLSFSELVIDREIAKSISSEDGSLRLFDSKTNRMYPYLSNGSIGLGVAITALNRTNKIFCFQDEIEAIIKATDYRIVLEPGLFDGISGFLLVDCFQENDTFIEEILETLNLFLLENSETYLVPGKMFYKLSSDIHTGVAGVLLGVLSAQNKSPLLWLPMMSKFIN